MQKRAKSSKSEMLIFGLCSTSDDWLSDPSDESQLKCENRPLKSSKNEMLIFGLHSTSDDWPLCWSIYRCRVRLQDWLHSGDEFTFWTGNGNFLLRSCVKESKLMSNNHKSLTFV